MSSLRWFLTCFWQYINLYFLKPFDAVNDTLTACLLRQFDWSGPVVEIGSGDGVFSYIMHGGAFPLWFDRYLITNLGLKDIYDTHKPDLLKAAYTAKSKSFKIAIDAKYYHVVKVRELGSAENQLVANYETLPLQSESVPKIFYYIPHGLRNHDLAINEAYRVLVSGGKMLILLYNSNFESSFLCHKLGIKLKGRLGKYFTCLDNGRHEELTKLAKTYEEWSAFFERHGFEILQYRTGLSTFAWQAYDVQTRSFLKPLINLFNFFPKSLRTFLKVFWMFVWYPFLIIFYCLFANFPVKLWSKNCYFAFEVCKKGSSVNK